MLRALAQFIYGNEYMYKNIRQSIYNKAINRIRVIPNVIIETERGNIRMHDYINAINDDGNHGGDIEISLVYDIFNINIGEYIEIRDDNNNLHNLRFVKYINDNNDENKNLLILTNINNNHFRLAYYNNTQIDYNYNPQFQLNLNNNELEDENKINTSLNITNIDVIKNNKKIDIINKPLGFININDKFISIQDATWPE